MNRKRKLTSEGEPATKKKSAPSPNLSTDKFAETPCSTSALTLRDLNADCIMDIFKYLNIHDLAAVATATDWCKVLAKDFFKRYHRNSLDLKFKDSEQFERCLKNFGNSATSVRISCKLSQRASSTIALEKVAKYCRNNVTKLTLDGFHIDLDSCADSTRKYEICHLMCKLKELNINNGDLFNAEQLFEFCDKTLEAINFRHVHMCTKTLNSFLREYPNLHTFILFNFWKCSITSYHIQKLLRLNPNIQTLKLARSTLSRHLFNAVCRLPELTSLTIRNLDTFNFELVTLAQIPKLQRLSLNGGSHTSVAGLIDALATKSSLTHLELEVIMRVDLHMLQQLSQNENLQVLKLMRVDCIDLLPYIAANFINLLELHFSDYQLTRQHISDGLLTPLIAQMKYLRILNVQHPYDFSWNFDHDEIEKICGKRTIQSNLLVFLANDYRRASRFISRDNISIVFPCDGVVSRDFNYDFSDNKEEFPETYERVQRIAQRNQVVRIKNSSNFFY